MPRAPRGTSEEHEQFMYQVFQGFYSNPENAGQEMSIDKANQEHRKKFGAMLRNRKAYEIRRSVKAQAVGHQPGGLSGRVLNRGETPLVAANSSQAAVLLEGSPEQISWLRTAALAQLGWRVDHSTSAYAVLVRF